MTRIVLPDRSGPEQRPDRVQRKAIPRMVKDFALARAGGTCECGCGRALSSSDLVEFDHDPALFLREWDEGVRDFVPPGNDPNHVFALIFECHREKTKEDRKKYDKINRLIGRTKTGPKQKIPSRPFNKPQVIYDKD